MSETNLLKSKYALDLRDIRISHHIREKLDFRDLTISPRGLIDVSEISKLNQLSSFLQEDKIDDQKSTFSAGNLNLYSLNERVRVAMFEIFSKLLNQNLFSMIEKEWSQLDSESKKQSENLFSALFFENDSVETEIDELVRYYFSYKNPAHTLYNKEFFGSKSEFDKLQRSIEKPLLSTLENLPSIDEGKIIDFLNKPEILFPNSIKGQIKYIIENWAKYLSQGNLKFLLLALDLVKEEEKFRGFGPGPSDVYEYGGKASFDSGDVDYERFSQDQHWMPQLVLLAKNIHVWLDQLSRKYNKEIKILSDIPEQELDILSSRGITGLWLVGIWERSSASKKIKNKMGNESAIASAYSIYDYEIASDLGGEAAYQDLKNRLMKRGIRLGADMVPNHMGIYSKWTVENPDWFIHSKEQPYPSYSYDGENLSETEGIEIYLEDHYYDQTDAAVTFKRVDSKTGEVHYIYHGNDGTSLPWNDTAQIDFLNEEAREEIIQKIVNVAKKFSIIRFDAAMVLAKQHIRRLWYPAAGEGGDIPSRSQFSMTDEEFNEAIPNEFWREVVDRVNEEASDTLLLAEAFWLLEGYFVRTLGMHRVYNSAFMKMLQDEENSKYRQTVKNVLEYDPEILKRFVNYLTTPDEDPAIEGFGDGDKYFGIATMMATMPGLPMFGHGQFEGFSEKYGMEFSKSQFHEPVDQEIVERHDAEIVPLLKKRYLFAGSENFYLYDFFTDEGVVNENVFAYSNRYEGEKALVIYNNKYRHASGWVKRSVAYSEKLSDKTTKLRQVDLFEGLNLTNDEGYLLFRDHVSGLEYIRSKDEIREKGLFVDVGAFKYHVFVNLKEVYDNQGLWSEIASKLNGEGTDNLQTMYDDLKSQSTEIEDVSLPEEVENDQPEEDLVTKLKIEVDELKDENIALKGQIAALNAELSQQENLRSEIQVLKEENTKLSDKNSELSKELEDESDSITEDDLNILRIENKSLESKNNDLKEQIRELKNEMSKISPETSKGEMEDLQEDFDEVQSRLGSAKSQINKLEEQITELTGEISKLEEENERLRQSVSDSPSESMSSEELLSSSLVDKIVNRLQSSGSGIKLRNLAMSLGISASVCLNHVKTMEKDGLVELKYTSGDDQNPNVISKKI